MRRCEPCGGPGPCLWDRPSGRYACQDCHSEPDDEFFTTHRTELLLQEMEDEAALAKRKGEIKDPLAAERERWMLKCGQQQARNAVFMQAMASVARRWDADFARRVVQRADEAAAAVRLEDFTRVHVNTGADDD